MSVTTPGEPGPGIDQEYLGKERRVGCCWPGSASVM
jgi:hypothetical protein